MDTSAGASSSAPPPAGPSTIDTLPSEILVPIVQYLPYKDRMRISQVSTRWHTIVDEVLGRKLFVGRSCQFTPDDEERYKHRYVPIANLAKLGVNTCYVGEVVDPFTSLGNVAYYWTKLKETMFGSSVPKFKYPHMMRNIFFDGPLPSRYFDSLVRPLANLERIDIHMSAFCCLHKENLALPRFNRMETVNIWGHKLTQGLFTQFYSSVSIVSNLLTLLEKNHFPHLSNLAMEYPFDLREESGRVTEALFDFLKRHKGSLQKFKISINVFVVEEPDDFDSQEDRDWIAKAKAASKLLKLKSVELSITSLYRVRLTKIWSAFIEAQKTLEEVSVVTFRLNQSIMARVCEQNYRTLISIGLSRLMLNNNGRFTPVDCSLLQNCSSLKNLLIEAMPTGMLELGAINITSLPQSLEKVELGSVVLRHEDTAFLLRGLTNLSHLFMADTGHTDDFGVDIDTLTQVIQRDRRVGCLTLYGCINAGMAVLDGGIPNGNPDNEMVISLRHYGMVEVKLNPAGYYEPLPRESLLPEMFVDDVD